MSKFAIAHEAECAADPSDLQGSKWVDLLSDDSFVLTQFHLRQRYQVGVVPRFIFAAAHFGIVADTVYRSLRKEKQLSGEVLLKA